MNNDFWNHLLTLVSATEQLDGNDEAVLSRLREHLETIDVMYRRAFDPADNYQEYVAVALCRAVNDALSRDESRAIPSRTRSVKEIG